MAQENGISFKVYLLNSDFSVSEVRRFGVDVGAVTNYLYLKEKLHQVFPNLRGQDLQISWKDGDNDTVTISSDEELLIALTEMQSNVKKLYITVKSSDQSKYLHENVECDGCNGVVHGNRYKCMQCIDYDLCSNCEASGKHSEHIVMRISQPTIFLPSFESRLHHLLGRKSRPAGECPFMERYGDSGAECKRSKKHGHNWSKSEHCKKFKKSDCDEDELIGESSDDCKKYKKFHKHARKHHHHHQPAERSSAYDVLEQLFGGVGTPSDNANVGDTSEAPHVKLIRTIGNTFANILDPLGVGIDIDVKSKSKNTTDKSETEQKGKEKKEENVPNDVETPAENRNMSTIEQLTEFLNNQKISEATDKEGWTVVDNTTETVKENSPVNNDATKLFATNIAATAGVAPSTSTASPGGPTNSVYPNIQQQEPIRGFVMQQQLHPNPIIEDSLKKMLSMGFTNDGGWLTQLLESKNGDIYKVLDVLQPVLK